MSWASNSNDIVTVYFWTSLQGDKLAFVSEKGEKVQIKKCSYTLCTKKVLSFLQ